VVIAMETAMLTDEQVMDLLRGDSPLNRARKELSFGSARIEQTTSQRRVSPVEWRRMEFEVTQKIIDAYCPETQMGVLASAIRKIAPDLANQLAERVAAYGAVEDQVVKDLVDNLNGTAP